MIRTQSIEDGDDIEQSYRELSLRDVAPVHVRISNLTVEFKIVPSVISRTIAAFLPHKAQDLQTKYKTALQNVSASLSAGSLTAIIGGSGSGKTTLLNSISGRVQTSKLRVSGTTTFNNESNLRGIRNAYVMQQDVLLPTLTPRETLKYAADLRLPSPSTKEERNAIVEEVILELGLKECADTRIGNSIHKGCSGGEKRRTSIGVQLLANPSVLFCDEPTTGLDAYSAYQIIQTLKKLAASGRTVVISIHAPRSEIWSLFDRVILLSGGHTVYSGEASHAEEYFRSIGHELPPFINPAEFLIDLAAVDNRGQAAEETTLARVRELITAWKQHSASEKRPESIASKFSIPYLDATTLPRVSFRRQVAILTKRTTLVTIRDPMGISGSLFEAVAMSIITGWIFIQLSGDLAGIRSREGSLYNAASLQGYLILLFECYRLTFDIQVFDREYNENVVSAASFLFSRRLARLLLEDLPVPIIFTLIYYFMVGFRHEVATFFIFLTGMIISQFCAVTLATLSVAISRDFARASLITNLSYTVQSIACGFFVQLNQIPVYMRWIKWAAYNFYILGALMANEFIGVNGGYYGQFYDCPHYPYLPTNRDCQRYVGRFILESLGYPTQWIWRPIIISMSYVIVFFIASWLVLKYWKRSTGIARARETDTEKYLGDEINKVRSSATNDCVNIDLSRYGLVVKSRNIATYFSLRKREILKPVTTSFEAGKLNVIMGPSGSGKTSLLQSMALRLTNHFSSSYRKFGKMTFNGVEPTRDVVRSTVSFVTQDDDALMSALTVRETLYFAALLRLPSTMSKKEKRMRAENVMLKLGLKDCADNMIGSDLKKGISGGEKRRVSIAIQILTDPKILLLDEPTSGLDAFTSLTIMEVLKALADEGKTIIFTIHQARADIFSSFDNILLLVRGGAPVYSGKGSNMLSHFAQLGFECPRTSNAADFALDLITVNLQEERKEAESREKVQNLIYAWENRRISAPFPPSRMASTAQLKSLKRHMNPFTTTFPVVLRRSFINIRRQPEVLLARIMQVVGIGIIFALFFAPLQSNYEAVQSRMGFVQQTAALYFVGMLQNLSVYPIERALFYREDLDNCYTTLTFLLSYTVLEIPFEIISCLIYGAITAFAINLKRTVKVFLISSFNCFAVTSCGESLGIMFCTLFSQHQGFSVTIMSVILSVANILGGIMSLNLPPFFEAWNWLSPIKYQVANMAVYGLRDQQFTCSDYQKNEAGQCPISTGEQVLELYNLNQNAGWNILGLGLCAIVYRLVAFLVLHIARSRFDWSFKGKRNKQGGVGTSVRNLGLWGPPSVSAQGDPL